MHHQHMTHDGALVALSFLVASLASYTALDMGTRLRRASGRARWLWLCGAAVVLGGGIWSMHFVAMLAMNVGMAVGYDFDRTALSLVIAITIVAVGLHIVTRPQPSIARQGLAGAIVGIGVAAMHYTGMSAVILDGAIHYEAFLVVVSVVIAVVAATAALWLTLNLTRPWHRAAAAVVMAIAVCGMHYTAMAATSVEMSSMHGVAVDPQSRLILALAVSIGLFLILCLAMVCIFADRRFEFLAEREAESLRAANAALTESQGAMRILLDNVDQGFLTVGADLHVDSQFSAVCNTILKEEPAGKCIADLLGDGDSIPANMRATLESVFRDSTQFVRELKLELLPGEFVRDGRFIKVGYKFLADSNRLMFILTDVTQTKLLTEAVERERKRLEMIVLAVTDAEALAGLVNEYWRFLAEELPRLVDRMDEEEARRDLYRRVHTFKGLLAQFSFNASPASLHRLETSLSDGDGWRAAPHEDFNIPALIADLEADLANVTDALGPDYMRAGHVSLTYEQVQAITQLVEAALAGEHSDSVRAPLRLVQQKLETLTMTDVKSALLVQSRGAFGLAARLGKRLAPMAVSGDAAALPPDRYGDFLRSLVHVFRNAVDHGIENPEERSRLGKPEAGSIQCAVSLCQGGLEILISDDGRGVDRTALEHKLIAAGSDRRTVRSASLEALVFHEGLSSRDAADEVSGRGVGLAAVKAELEKVGGAVSVRSNPGAGTMFRFFLPAISEEAAGKAERIAI